MTRGKNPSGGEKPNVRIAVREAIYAELSKWLKTPVTPGSPIPRRRNGELVYRPKTIVGSQFGPEDEILQAAGVPSRDVLQASLNRLTACRMAIDAAKAAFSELSPQEAAGTRLKRSNDVAGRVINAIGQDIAFPVLADIMLETLSEQIKSVENALSDRSPGRGRPRNEAAYAVAKKLAEIYTRYTERKPTYSENSDGRHGEYTRALELIFEALGWGSVDLKGPATKAVESITDEIFAELCRPLLIPLRGRISTAPLK